MITTMCGSGLRLFHALVVAVQISRVLRREELIAVRHLLDRPAHRAGGLLRIRDHGDEQVREGPVHGHLDHLRVHQDEPHVLRRALVIERHDDVVDADALAGAGRARDEHVRHAGQVRDDGLAARPRPSAMYGRCAAFKFLALQDIPQHDERGTLVRDLDADGVLAGIGASIRRRGAESAMVISFCSAVMREMRVPAVGAGSRCASARVRRRYWSRWHRCGSLPSVSIRIRAFSSGVSISSSFCAPGRLSSSIDGGMILPVAEDDLRLCFLSVAGEPVSQALTFAPGWRAGIPSMRRRASPSPLPILPAFSRRRAARDRAAGRRVSEYECRPDS